MIRIRSGKSSRKAGEGTTPEPELPTQIQDEQKTEEDAVSDMFHSASPSPVPPTDTDDERLTDNEDEQQPNRTDNDHADDVTELSRDITPATVPGFETACDAISRFVERKLRPRQIPPPLDPTPRRGGSIAIRNVEQILCSGIKTKFHAETLIRTIRILKFVCHGFCRLQTQQAHGFLHPE